MKKLVLSAIRGYRTYISPMFAPSCRFIPTCSQYAIEAIEVHGLLRGGAMSVRRLLRCHPFHRDRSFVYDPVTKPTTNRRNSQ